MAQEIERKFLVKKGFNFKNYGKTIEIYQGYLCLDKERTVRIRIKAQKGYLTVKGITKGFTRYEFENEIPLKEAENLLRLCVPPILYKTRTYINYKNHIFEIDEFYNENEGLITAEIELKSENESFDKPEWLGKEVTNDKRYYNANLIKNPYSKWKK